MFPALSEIPYHVTVFYTVMFCLFVYVRKFSEHSKKSLPEPSLFLVIWYLIFKRMSADAVISKICQRYGKIIKFKMGELKLVVLNDPDLIRKAFNIPDLNGRSDTKCFCIPCEGKTGIVASESRVWVEQRRFAIHNLKNFGFGRKTMENMIKDEVHDIIDIISKQKCQPMSIQKLFSLASLNSLWTLITGQRYALDDSELNNLLERICGIFGESVMNPLFVCFPSIAELFPNVTGWKKFLDFAKSYRMFFKGHIAEHRISYNEENPRDLIDTYLQEIIKCKDENSSFYNENGEKNLVTVMSDMFLAGSETSSSALQWAVLCLSQHQRVQKKFQKEIDEVIGTGNVPSLTDRSKMPYTEALVMEILRKYTVIPLGLMHSAIKDVDLDGYRIPKRTSILSNLQGIHNDPVVWGDPENFRPERFMDENGQCIKKHPSFMPFSVGKRICIGETMSRDTIFLFLTTIFQKFELLPDPTVKNVSFQPKIGFILAPESFKVICKERNVS